MCMSLRVCVCVCACYMAYINHAFIQLNENTVFGLILTVLFQHFLMLSLKSCKSSPQNQNCLFVQINASQPGKYFLGWPE